MKGRVDGGIVSAHIDNGFQLADTGQSPVGLGMKGEVFAVGKGVLPVAWRGVVVFLPLEAGSPVNHRVAFGGVGADGMGGRAGKRQG